MSRVTRRGILTGGALAGGALTGLGLAGCSAQESAGPAGGATASATAATATDGARQRVAAAGEEQAGIVRPVLPQAHLHSLVYDLDLPTRRIRTALPPLLAEIGTTILALTTTPTLGIEPGDLTVTVGIGPRLVAAVDPDLPGAQRLPGFAGEEIVAVGERPGILADDGDLWLQVCASEPLVVVGAVTALAGVLEGRARLRWGQKAWRGSYVTAPEGVQAPRNVQGFADGVINPADDAEREEGVWIGAPAALAGGTIAVVRRFRIDVAAWADLPVADQEAAVGRHRDTSMPLSGEPDVDLQAKTAAGDYLIPTDAHVRRAHPLAVGVPMMLRRSYSVDDPDPGLLFISFQNTLRAFTVTMNQLEDADRMMEFATTTATGTFLVLPGFSDRQPLGSMLV